MKNQFQTEDSSEHFEVGELAKSTNRIELAALSAEQIMFGLHKQSYKKYYYCCCCFCCFCCCCSRRHRIMQGLSSFHVQPFVACSSVCYPPPPLSKNACGCALDSFLFIDTHCAGRSVGRSAGEAPNFSSSFSFGFSFSFRLIEFRLLSINKEQQSTLLCCSLSKNEL